MKRLLSTYTSTNVCINKWLFRKARGFALYGIAHRPLCVFCCCCFFKSEPPPHQSFYHTAAFLSMFSIVSFVHKIQQALTGSFQILLGRFAPSCRTNVLRRSTFGHITFLLDVASYTLESLQIMKTHFFSRLPDCVFLLIQQFII